MYSLLVHLLQLQCTQLLKRTNCNYLKNRDHSNLNSIDVFIAQCSVFLIYFNNEQKRVNSTPKNDIYLTLDIQINFCDIYFVFKLLIFDNRFIASQINKINKWKTTTQNMQKICSIVM